MKNIIRSLMVFIILQTFFISTVWAYSEVDGNIINVKGKVLEVIKEESGAESGYGEDTLVLHVQQLKILITTGDYKGREVIVENYLQGNMATDVNAKVGQKLLMAMDISDPLNVRFFISTFERDIYIYIIIGIFLVLILIIGKMQGLKTIITLFVTMSIIFVYTIPSILKGTSPVYASIVSSIIITVITMITIAGFSQKAVSAIIGTAMGVIIAGIISYIISNVANLSGVDSNEATMLLYIPQGIKFNFKELLFAGIIIGTMGATMDISMSVSSSMNELLNNNGDISLKELMTSGLNVGKDVMGTMTNTLILAYTGSSISLILVFFAYKTSVMEILNLDVIATEIVRSIAGSIGIILSVPCTAMAVCILENVKRKKSKI